MSAAVSNATKSFTSYWIGLIDRERVIVPSLELVHSPWVYATACSALVGLSGLLPVLFLTRSKTSQAKLRFMLSFACGGLLGDVFLHLLPEAHQRMHRHDLHGEHLRLGMWVLAGLLSFVFIEILCKAGEKKKEEEEGGIAVSGYLNLVANCIDNFAHGLAVGGAFLVDNKTGFITTSCILFHEIPHEIGDFAILMKSGFARRDAAKAQLGTASLGIVGSLAALTLHSSEVVEGCTAWIIPFTSGGFIQIALVTVLPDLLKSDTLADFLRVICGIGLGIAVMMAVSSF